MSSAHSRIVQKANVNGILEKETELEEQILLGVCGVRGDNLYFQ